MTGENRIRQTTGPCVFLCALAILLFGIAGCEDRLARMEENQVKLQAMVAANARQLATVSSQIHVGNGEIQEGIRTLDQNDKNLAAGITAVQGEQVSLSAMIESGNQTTHSGLTSLDEKQRLLQDGVAEVADVAQRTAAGVTAIAREQTALHQTVQTARQELGDSIAVVAGNQRDIRTDITQLQQADGRIVEQLVAMTADQTAMQQTLDANHRIVAGQMAAVIENQQGLQQGLSDSREMVQAGLDKLDGDVSRVAADLTTVMNEQSALQEKVKVANEALVIQAAVMEEDRQTWTSGLQALHQETQDIAADVTTLAAGQDFVHQTLERHNESAGEQITQLSHQQEQLHGQLDVLAATTGRTESAIATLNDNHTALCQTIRTGMDDLQQRTDRVGTQLDSLAGQQASLQQRIHAGDEALARRATELADTQETLQAQLDLLMATTSQSALDILGLHDSQTLLQQAISAGVKDLGLTTDQMATQVAAITAGQTSLRDTIRADHEAANAAMKKIAGRADQIADDVAGVAAGQASLRNTISEGHETLSARMTTVADAQRGLRTDVARVGQIAEETAANVVQVASTQKAFDQTLSRHVEVMNGHAAILADNQAQLQTGLDIVTATAGQTALDVLAVNAGQTQLAEDMQADRQELAVRLAALAESQQQWMQRLDAAQDNVQTLAASVSSIEQRIATLQGSLEDSLNGLATQLGDNGQKRVEFETRVNEDIQAMADVVAQLSQIEDLLKEQMQQIQNRTKSQMDDIISAIQRLNQAPAEMKVSSTGTKPESSVVEAAAK